MAAACALLCGTHPAHAARRARAPAASTPHAHKPARTRTSPGPARGRLEQPCTRAPVPPARGACTRAGQPRTQGARAPRSGGLHTGRPTTDTSTPPGRKTTNQRHKYAPRGGKDAEKMLRARKDTTPETPIDLGCGKTGRPLGKNVYLNVDVVCLSTNAARGCSTLGQFWGLAVSCDGTALPAAVLCAVNGTGCVALMWCAAPLAADPARAGWQWRSNLT